MAQIYECNYLENNLHPVHVMLGYIMYKQRMLSALLNDVKNSSKRMYINSLPLLKLN